MDTQYVDQYIRRKKHQHAADAAAALPAAHHSSLLYPADHDVVDLGAAAASSARFQPMPATSLAAAAQQVLVNATQRAQQHVRDVHQAAQVASAAQRDEAAERVGRQVHLLVERIDTSAVQLATAEDKIANLTKMVKMQQQLSDERERALREEITELRSKLKRADRTIDQVSEAQATAAAAFRATLESQRAGFEERLQAQISQVQTVLRREFQVSLQSQRDELETMIEQQGAEAEPRIVATETTLLDLSRVVDELTTATEEARARDDAAAQRLDDITQRASAAETALDDLDSKLRDTAARTLEDATARAAAAVQFASETLRRDMAKASEDVLAQTQQRMDDLRTLQQQAATDADATRTAVDNIRAQIQSCASRERVEELTQRVEANRVELRRAADTDVRELRVALQQSQLEAVRALETDVSARVEDVRRVAEGNKSKMSELRTRVEETTVELRAKITECRTSHDQTAAALDDVRVAIQDARAATDALAADHTDIAAQLRDVERQFEARLATAMQQQHASLQEGIDLLRGRTFDAVSDVASRVTSIETAQTETNTQVARFASMIQEQAEAATAESGKNHDYFVELRDLIAQTRQIGSGELDSTKQWASRNMQRLKKHLDLVVGDISALRQVQLDLGVRLERGAAIHRTERDRLMTQLTQKAKEAEVLSGLLDQEIAEGQEMTQRENAQRSSRQQQQHHSSGHQASAARGAAR